VLQGGHVARRWTGDARRIVLQGGCRVARQAYCKAADVARCCKREGSVARADAVLQGGRIARRMVLQGGRVARWTGDARQCCKVLQAGRECCKAGRERCKAWTGKDNMMLQYLPVIHTTANRATPPDGRDRK